MWFLQMVPFLIMIGVVLWQTWRLTRRDQAWGPKITLMAFWVYALAIVALCLAPTFYHFGAHQASYIWIGRAMVIYRPFQDLDLEYWLNLLLTLPLGIFFGLTQRWSWRNLLGLGLLMGFGLETIQFGLDQLIDLQRVVDIDDVITNFGGTVVGGGVYWCLRNTRLVAYFQVAKK
ncbi:VanZ family protein [Loigolactobacillus bifermentans]|jgi:glycopeptide antibiotics resistance protein|uniref:VanZ-like domain-containing protein n=1 Tax=Loigolactobacillus bifermentans DSM 20003 TaxID=1423726 RepID=A0A0R1GE71_9LACO|nr:VanZ family protein [Loigolactobacillus bifermentans]KRK32542.1 hypothetical protein FC07_GL001967 [Loigolactobacillus bifermentans DSM 20003]QGG60215.1 hypothetical protein LB003_06970 [Loigolactobacillus bifermentans]